MKRMPLYSSSSRSRTLNRPAGRRDQASEPAPVAAAAPVTRSRWGKFHERHERLLLVATGGLFALLAVVTHALLTPAPREITQDDIDASVLRTLETQPLPSPAVKAHELVRESVVRVRGFGPNDDDGEYLEQSVGSGVVIVDTGIILTNLHVVAGAKRITVVFADGLEAEATVTGVRPEHDLAVLQAKTIPDDLVAATMRSTGDLALGDLVVAVGFPFGIGPSVSSGVISGLRREFQSPEGKRLLTNLIQFDAAVNSGSSGGPLVTSDGAVVGIVTAILSPAEQKTFVGIGFAIPIENAAAAVGVPPF